MVEYDYIHNGAEIYAQSFATIRAEADLSGFAPDEARVAVRIIHACGMVQVTDHIAFSSSFVSTARATLLAGKPVLCDSEMVAHGITRARLPAHNQVICTLRDRRTPEVAAFIGNTRSAAAVDLWADDLDGALIAIGNAPTALFRLLELIRSGGKRPAAIIGMPVGFVGAAESKEALAAFGEIPWAIVKGRLGGSAMTAACVNALASEEE